jgi:hypothetical protein
MRKPSSFYHMNTFKITHHGNIWSLASMLHTKGLESHFLSDDPVKNAIHSNYTVKKAIHLDSRIGNVIHSYCYIL